MSNQIRKRKKCEHGNCIYECYIIEKGKVCGKSLCSHQRRKTECKYCKKIYCKNKIPISDNIIKIETENLNHQKEHIKKLIIDIPQKGCSCDNKRRKFISSIIGCGKSHGCNYDKFKCSICNKTFQYSSSVYHHIKLTHIKIVALYHHSV
jgi:hypothetical protein